MGPVLLLLALLWFGGAVYVAVGAVVLSVERGYPPELSVEALARYVREVSALCLNTLMMPLGALDGPPSGPAGRPDRTPLVLVPGHGRNRSCFFFLAAALRARGWGWVWAVNNGEGAIPRMGERLAESVDEMLRASGAEQVDLICHSMGGIVAAWYINQLDGAPRVRRVITIATPWKGTKLAALAQKVDGRQLVPGSGVLAHAGVPSVPVTAIYTDTDTIIIPPANARLDPAEYPAGNVESLNIPGMGHEQLLFSPAVVEAIALRLGER